MSLLSCCLHSMRVCFQFVGSFCPSDRDSLTEDEIERLSDVALTQGFVSYGSSSNDVVPITAPISVPLKEKLTAMHENGIFASNRNIFITNSPPALFLFVGAAGDDRIINEYTRIVTASLGTREGPEVVRSEMQSRDKVEMGLDQTYSDGVPLQSCFKSTSREPTDLNEDALTGAYYQACNESPKALLDDNHRLEGSRSISTSDSDDGCSGKGLSEKSVRFCGVVKCSSYELDDDD